MAKLEFTTNTNHLEHIYTPPEGETIIGLAECDGQLFVSTGKNVYRIELAVDYTPPKDFKRI